MKYATIRKLDISNGPFIGVSLFLQGCLFHCKNCFNQTTWPLDGGKEFTDETKETLFELLRKDGIKRLSILGGEPLLQAKELGILLKEVKENFPDIKIWMWTGFVMDEILGDQDRANTLKYCDFIVDGRYKEELKDYKLRFKGSSNQRIWEKDPQNKFIISKYND